MLVADHDWTMGVVSPQSLHPIGRFQGVGGQHRVEAVDFAVLQGDKCFGKDEPEHPRPE